MRPEGAAPGPGQCPCEDMFKHSPYSGPARVWNAEHLSVRRAIEAPAGLSYNPAAGQGSRHRVASGRRQNA